MFNLNSFVFLQCCVYQAWERVVERESFVFFVIKHAPRNESGCCRAECSKLVIQSHFLS